MNLCSIRAALVAIFITAETLSGLAAPAYAQTEATSEPPSPVLSCDNARFVKSITLARAYIPAPPQDVLHLGAMVGDAVAAALEKTGHFSVVLTEPTRSLGLEPAIDAFSREQTPYFVRLSGHDFGVTGQSSAWSFINPSTNPRGGTLRVALQNGQTARDVASTEISTQPIDASLFNPPVDARGTLFSQSAYGKLMHSLSSQAAEWIEQSLGCEPLWGQVINVEGGQITINRGAKDGLRMSDRITVLQRSDPLTALGQTHLPNRYLMQQIGQADIAYLGEHTAIIRLSGSKAVQLFDVIEVGQ